VAKRIVLVKHNNDPNDDRASLHLAARGFALDWRYPYAGDSLPADDEAVAGTVVYGGGQGVPEMARFPFLAEEARWMKSCTERGIPTLGICLGAQILAHAHGAKVGPHPEGLQEFGFYDLEPTNEGAATIPAGMAVPQMHYHTFELPPGATLLASSRAYRNQAMQVAEKAFGFQFHPEQSHATFKRWQQKPWAPWGKPGVQTREEQDARAEQHDAGVGAWFTGFLDRLFGSPA
jgi:GMP synthase (glutamine-hydrolysing)